MEELDVLEENSNEYLTTGQGLCKKGAIGSPAGPTWIIGKYWLGFAEINEKSHSFALFLIVKNRWLELQDCCLP